MSLSEKIAQIQIYGGIELSLISVIVPIYKVEKHLVKCIDSILAQTHRDLEIILVDDGSPDGCPAICDQYASHDPRIKVIHQSNGGSSVARNAGLAAAQGDFIAWVDSDDWIAPDMYESLLACMKETDSDVVACSSRVVYKDHEEIYRMSPQKENWTSEEALKSFLIGGCFTAVLWDKLYKRFIFDDIRFPEGKIHDDEFVMHEIYDKAKKISFIHEAKYYWFQRDDSMTHACELGSKSLLHAYEAFRSRFEYIRSKKIDFLPFAAVSLLDCTINCKISSQTLKGKNLSEDDEKYLKELAGYSNDYRNLKLHELISELPLSCFFKIRLKDFLYFLHPSICSFVMRMWRGRK